MNSQLESWRVQAYDANVLQLSQQKGTRLGNLVRNETFKGKSEFFDRLGLATAQLKSGRNTSTPNLDITHSRRMLVSRTYEWATLVDRQDKLENIHSPENEYAIAASNALGRSMDSTIISAALGSAATGEDGSSSTALGVAQKVVSVSSNALARFNVQALRKAKFLMDAAEAEGKRYIAHTAGQLEALLGQTEVTSSDYNSVKALVMGEVDTFLGFKFIRLELLPLSSVNSSAQTFDPATGLYSATGNLISSEAGYSTAVSAIAFASDGLILGRREGSVGRITEESTKSFSMQVYNSMDFGAVRMEEVKVVEIISKA